MKMIKSAVIGTLMVPAFMLAAGNVSAEETTSTTVEVEATYLTSVPENVFYSDSLKGHHVKSTVEDDENIGTIHDLIIDESGQVTAVIIGVGGFLGMGEKDVAIEWDSLELIWDAEGSEYDVRVNASKEALKEAAEFERDEAEA